jgi:hypothetical protein
MTGVPHLEKVELDYLKESTEGLHEAREEIRGYDTEVAPVALGADLEEFHISADGEKGGGEGALGVRDPLHVHT